MAPCCELYMHDTIIKIYNAFWYGNVFSSPSYVLFFTPVGVGEQKNIFDRIFILFFISIWKYTQKKKRVKNRGKFNEIRRVKGIDVTAKRYAWQWHSTWWFHFTCKVHSMNTKRIYVPYDYYIVSNLDNPIERG